MSRRQRFAKAFMDAFVWIVAGLAVGAIITWMLGGF